MELKNIEFYRFDHKIKIVESTKQLELFEAVKWVDGNPVEWSKLDVIAYETAPQNASQAFMQMGR